MSFKKGFFASIVLGCVMLCLAAVSFASSDAVKPEEALRAAFPQVKFDSMSPSEIPGLYEVVAGQNIFYYYPAKDLILTGEIIGKDLKSRTA